MAPIRSLQTRAFLSPCAGQIRSLRPSQARRIESQLFLDSHSESLHSKGLNRDVRHWMVLVSLLLGKARCRPSTSQLKTGATRQPRTKAVETQPARPKAITRTFQASKSDCFKIQCLPPNCSLRTSKKQACCSPQWQSTASSLGQLPLT